MCVCVSSSHLGSGFKSYDEYLFGKFNMKIKLQAGNSAGVVTTFYVSSFLRPKDLITVT